MLYKLLVDALSNHYTLTIRNKFNTLNGRDLKDILRMTNMKTLLLPTKKDQQRAKQEPNVAFQGSN